MNTPVQGTAADIMKMAMVRVVQQLRAEKLEARLVLQVHDELIVETSPDEADRAAKILCEGMESIVQLQVPLEAEVRRGASWFDTK
jgi:DNA polymerase-1